MGWIRGSECGWPQKLPGRCRKNPDFWAHLEPLVPGPRSLEFTVSLVMLIAGRFGTSGLGDLFESLAREAGTRFVKALVERLAAPRKIEKRQAELLGRVQHGLGPSPPPQRGFLQMETQRAGHCPRPGHHMHRLREGILGPGFCVHLLVLPLPGSLGQVTISEPWFLTVEWGVSTSKGLRTKYGLSKVFGKG